MCLDWKNQYGKNDYTNQSNLQIQWNLYQITKGIFHRTRTKTFAICMETQKTPNSQSNLKKEKRKAGENNLLDSRLYYEAIVNKRVSYWHKKQTNKQTNKTRNIDQWNKIKSPEINPCTYGHFTLTKETKINNGEETTSSINGARKTGQLHVKE